MLSRELGSVDLYVGACTLSGAYRSATKSDIVKTGSSSFGYTTCTTNNIRLTVTVDIRHQVCRLYGCTACEAQLNDTDEH
jgi:hypothetical protein